MVAMESGARKKLLIGGLLAGSVAVTLFAVVFFTLGPLVFGDSAASGSTAEDRRYAQKFEQILSFVSKNYVDEVDRQKLFDGAMKGLFSSLGDPYSLYLSTAEMMSLTDTTTGEFGGVGLYVNKIDPAQADKSVEPRDHFVEVVAPIEDTPAWKAGLLAGDAITKIDGEEVAALTMDEVLKRLRGQPGTNVKVTVLRGTATTLDFTLRREIIQVPSVKSTWIGDDIAYLRITQFTAHTAEAFDAAVAEFAKKGFTRLVVDLRNNPGGLLEAVAKVGGRFFKDGVIVSTRSRVAGESSVFEAQGEQTIPDNVRIIVLVDKGSASAAEILSGALKDRKRGYLLGDTTYGKGSVQQVIPFDKTGFKLTMARYYTPSGINIDKVGIAPHQTLKEKELTDAELGEYRKLLDAKTIQSFAQSHPAASKADVETFVKTLKTQGITLEPRLLARLTRLELDRTNNRAGPVVDLDFDLVLQEAVRLLRGESLVIP
jgi:carboxyl-terminal processing protease